MNKTERRVVDNLIEWAEQAMLKRMPEMDRLAGKRYVAELKVLLDAKDTDIYLVVCENGFARGTFDPKVYDIPRLEKCARLRNALCACGGQHRIVRCVQQGTGRDIE